MTTAFNGKSRAVKSFLPMLAALAVLGSPAAQYRLPDGVALYYPFDTPETAMKSMGSVEATLAQGMGAVRFQPDGRQGGCLHFDGTATLRLPSVPDGVPSEDEPYTVAAWVRADSDCPGSGGWISYGGLSRASGNSFRMHGADGVQNYWNGVDINVRTAGIADGNWHHVAGTWDGKMRRIYYDGKPAGENGGRPEIKRDVFMIGTTMHDRAFKGDIDEVLVARRAFSPGEVALLCADGIGRSGVRKVTAEDAEAVFSGCEFMTPKYTRLSVSRQDAVKSGWTMRFKFNADGLSRDTSLADVPGAVRVLFRFAGEDPGMKEQDERFGNYINFRTADGKCPVIEASIPGVSTIGVPLGCLKRPKGSHEVVIRRGADAHWFMTVDEAYDEDGIKDREERWPAESKVAVFSKSVSGLKVETPAIPRPAMPDERPFTRPLQFWTPDGHNTWVGDVVVGVYRDRFHIFYLIDRRHHASKGHTGGHYFAHISSPDLVHWFDHPHAVELDEWWHTIGTGTPFVWNGKFCLAYGLHTTRFMKAEETTEPFMKDYFEKHGDTGVFEFGEVKGYPLGGTFAVSDDGIHFKRTNKLIHPAQNPTVYNRADGRLGFVNSYGGIHGIYVSDKDPWGWKLEDGKIPVSGDCPCEFEWNGHHYLIQGFTRMAYNPDGTPGNWTSWTQTGDDVYDGLCVPMVAPWKGDRRIIAGWIVHPRGWGGWLVVHELVQYPDGKLGIKWLKEAPPPGEISEFDCMPGEKFAVRYKGDGIVLELSVDAKLGRAQYANVRKDGSVLRMNSNAERERAGGNEALKRRNGPPGSADEYAIERIRGLDRPFKIRIAAYYDQKSDVTLFDAEIAGQRTMICKRRGRFVREARE